MCHGQILQLATSRDPGEFIAWVMAGGDMFKVPLKVPRHFFINTRASLAEEHPGKRVSRVLPHGRSSFNLIEVKGVMAYQVDSIRSFWISLILFSIQPSHTHLKRVNTFSCAFHTGGCWREAIQGCWEKVSCPSCRSRGWGMVYISLSKYFFLWLQEEYKLSVQYAKKITWLTNCVWNRGFTKQGCLSLFMQLCNLAAYAVSIGKPPIRAFRMAGLWKI